MDKDTGKFYEESMIPTSKSKKVDYITFEPGEEVEVKGETFVVCRIKNDRLILRSSKMAATIREQRVEVEYWRKRRSLEAK